MTSGCPKKVLSLHLHAYWQLKAKSYSYKIVEMVYNGILDGLFLEDPVDWSLELS